MKNNVSFYHTQNNCTKIMNRVGKNTKIEKSLFLKGVFMMFFTGCLSDQILSFKRKINNFDKITMITSF